MDQLLDMAYEVKGEKVNRGGGYGLEIPCVIYRLYGPSRWYIQRLKDTLEPLIAAGHL